MSLFGDEDAPAARSKASLFDDESAKPSKTGSSMFADSAADDDDSSPWGFTPKKNTGRGSLVKSLLADADVPDAYIDAFDAAQTAGQVDAQHARRLLQETRLGADSEAKIWGIVSSNNANFSRLGRGEFNVLLALIGLAQEGEELGLDAVDERRKRLPVPRLASLAQQQQQRPAQQQQQTPASPPQATSPQHVPAQTRKASFGNGLSESDPWGSPALHKNHNHAANIGSGSRTTSTFTTTGSEPSDGRMASSYSNGQDSAGAGAGSWGASASFGHGSASFGGAGTSSGGFGDENNEASTPRRPAQPRTVTGKGVEEIVTVNLLGEKEGVFMFQHRNYEVASVRRNSKVIRRYSDFVWLLDCLHKRYPFRQLPLLPPKRMAINGNHLAADMTFIEKRRRGLARFANALVRHPILREEQLVVMFLTVPTELSVWRKQATISVQEEFIGKSLPSDLEDSLPQDLLDTFDTCRSGTRRSAELYINLCSLVERLCKRKESLAVEYGRLNLNLLSIAETSGETYAIDRNDVPLLNEGITGVAKHVSTSQALLDDEARAWDEGVLEDLKTMRDALVSLRDMFDRRDRYAKDNIPQLERRIQQNELKLQTIKAKGDAAKPGEAEKVENAIVSDKQSIVDQHARGVFIKECIRDELAFFQTTQYHVSRLHQDWAQERVKYSELQADNFRGLVDAVENMPQGD